MSTDLASPARIDSSDEPVTLDSARGRWLLALASLILVGGSLGDRLGRRRMFTVGVLWFAAASAAMMQGSFRPEDRARAIGLWSGMSGLSTILGPLLGGGLVQWVGWQYIFWINVPIAAAAAGVGALVAFARSQRRPHPMIPPAIFASRVFNANNLLTFVVYGVLTASTLLLVVQLQVVVGYDPLSAGLATLPLTIVMLLLSGRSAALASRIGPRPQLTIGPVLCAVGAVLLLGVDAGSSYWFDVLPGLLVFAFGLTCLIAPLTTTVLAATPDRWAGIASGVNNAVARAGGLLAVAALPAAVGLSGDDYNDPVAFDNGYQAAMVVCATLLLLGGALGWFGLRERRSRRRPATEALPAPRELVLCRD